MLTANELRHQIDSRGIRETCRIPIAGSHVVRTHIAGHVRHRVASLPAWVPCRQVKALAMCSQARGGMTRQCLHCSRRCNCSRGEGPERIVAPGLSHAETSDGQRWELRNAERPWHEITCPESTVSHRR